MVLRTAGFKATTNYAFQLFVSPFSIPFTTANTPIGFTSTVVIIVSVGGGILICAIVLVICCIKRNRTNKSGNNGKEVLFSIVF